MPLSTQPSDGAGDVPLSRELVRRALRVPAFVSDGMLNAMLARRIGLSTAGLSRTLDVQLFKRSVGLANWSNGQINGRLASLAEQEDIAESTALLGLESAKTAAQTQAEEIRRRCGISDAVVKKHFGDGRNLFE